MALQSVDAACAWQLVLDSLSQNGATLALPGTDSPALTLGSQDDPSSWTLHLPATADATRLLSLFLPLCRPLAGEVSQQLVGQLGQSLDGRIATVTGASRFINGTDGLTHLHRLRAVSDAVVVGAGTAMADNPRLTVRLASGPNPVRVVIDRQRRVPPSHNVFNDGQAATLHLVGGELAPDFNMTIPRSGVLEVPCLGDKDEPLEPAKIKAVLAGFGLRRLFIEGGGVTVSAFLTAGMLDRLHVIVAPMIIGSGRPAFSLPEIENLDYALRPANQMVNLGSDMLFDLDLTPVRA
ncbi:MAG: RibD family protein [Oleiphilaceae bacterium]|nr:RibD family protein [Oleiphilaceae bacterium]